MLADADGTPRWRNSAITEEIWIEMQSLEYRHNAIKDKTLARKICGIVLKRMVAIYEEWHGQLRIGFLMDEIRDVTYVAPSCGESSASPESFPDISTSPA